MRVITIGVVVLLVSLAGCGWLPGEGSTDDASPTESMDIQSTPTLESTATGLAETAEATTTELESTSAPRARLSEIALSTSDLPSVYESQGTLDLTREDASGEDAERFEDRGLMAVYERTYTLNDSSDDAPEIVFSSAMRYRSATAATDDLDRIIAEFEASGSSVSERSITNSMTARIVTFENDQGYRNVVYYGRTDDIVFYVVTSDPDGSFEERAEELFKRMLVEASGN